MPAKPALALIRPLDGASAAAMVILGGLVGGAREWGPVAAAAIATFAAMSFAMAANDCIDQVGDCVNGRRRPLALGTIDSRKARGITVAAAVASVAAASVDGLIGVFVITAYLLLSWLYSRYLKARAALMAPLIVSVLSGSTVVFGGVVVGNFGLTFAPAATATVFMFGREVLKGARDEIGDRAQGCRTFAIVHGPRCAVRWYSWASVLGGTLAATPLLLGARLPYAVFALLNLVYLSLLARYVARRPGASEIARVVDLSKISWVFWIGATIAFWG